MTDESIIDLYFARDSMAIHYSQEQYGNLCHAVASNILPTLEDAQECVNDTWLKAWNSIPPTRPKHPGAVGFGAATHRKGRILCLCFAGSQPCKRNCKDRSTEVQRQC